MLMVKNKLIALIYRVIALVVISIGLARQFGFFHGYVSFYTFQFYTIQSNLLAIIMFTMLIPCNVNGLREGIRGSAVYFTRFRMVCSVNLLLTFFVFWLLLAPNLPIFYLLSIDNMLIHLIAPLLCLIDYILFSETGKLKYRDAYFTCIFPYIYSTSAIIAGYIGFNYGARFVSKKYLSSEIVGSYWVPRRAPYFFLDFDEIGATVLLYIAGLVVFLLLLGHAFYLLDKKMQKKHMLINGDTDIVNPPPTRLSKRMIGLLALVITVPA